MSTSVSVKSMPETELEIIFSNADKLCKTIKTSVEVDLNFDIEGVRWTDGFINRNRERWSEEDKHLFLHAIAAYFGECLRQRFKGVWVYHQEFGPGVKHKTGIEFPFNKVRKQIVGEDGASILGMYEVAISLSKIL